MLKIVSAKVIVTCPGRNFVTLKIETSDGITGLVTSSMLSARLLQMAIRVEGSEGTLKVFNPIAPQYLHRVTIKGRDGTRHERVHGEATYTHQLRAFVAAIAGEPTNLTPPSDSIANMRVLDAAYRAAGLEPRTPTSSAA